ncbi:ERF family protein [Actinotignum sp. GS-2025e]|uniref:ERF family protein n=1 Tax=unclassified Actinotignum TaxID=2632702 RepID=UPI003F489513
MNPPKTSSEEAQPEAVPLVVVLNRVMRDVGAVGKNERNQRFQFNFRGIDAVINAVSPAFRKHGVVAVPSVVNREIRETVATEGRKVCNIYLTVDYTFYGPAGDSLTARVASESFDYGDKATAKAMSVAYRTALLQVLCLPTSEDDPDTKNYERANFQTSPRFMTPEQGKEIMRLADRLQYTDEQKAGLAATASNGRAHMTRELTTDEAGVLIQTLRETVRRMESQGGEQGGSVA